MLGVDAAQRRLLLRREPPFFVELLFHRFEEVAFPPSQSAAALPCRVDEVLQLDAVLRGRDVIVGELDDRHGARRIVSWLLAGSKNGLRGFLVSR